MDFILDNRLSQRWTVPALFIPDPSSTWRVSLAFMCRLFFKQSGFCVNTRDSLPRRSAAENGVQPTTSPECLHLGAWIE